MYKLHEKIEVELNKITPKNLRTLKEMGIKFENLQEEGLLLFQIYSGESEKLSQLIKAVFLIQTDISEYLDDIDIKVVNQGIADFFS
jgi:hypothetical protein